MPLLRLAGLAALPAIALLLTGIVSLNWRPSERMRNVILHFAAGVVFAVVAVELLPDIVRRHEPLEVAIGFALGVASMLWLRSRERQGQTTEGANRGYPTALIAMIGIDIALDGFLLGVASMSTAEAGLLLALSFVFEVVSLGFATSVSLSGFGKRTVLKTFGGLALALVACALLAGALLARAPAEVMELTLSFGLAALLYLVCEELLVEAHEVRETPAMAATFFAGFGSMLLLGMLI